MLDGRSDRAYADLRRYYGFDLGKWLNGKTHESVAAVIAMLKNLPRHSAWRAHYDATRAAGSEDFEDTRRDNFPEPTPEQAFEQSVSEREDWTPLVFRIASLENSVKDLLRLFASDYEAIWTGPDFMLSKEEGRERRDKIRKNLSKAKRNKPQRASTVEGLYASLGYYSPPTE